MPKYKCGVCGHEVDRDAVVFKDHTEKHILDIIKAKNPKWIDTEGFCKKCIDYYRAQIQGSEQ